jgi:hypothetical protein
VPAGSEVTGSVIDAKESARVKGKAMVAFGIRESARADPGE